MRQEMEEMSWETVLEGKVLLPGRGTEARLGLSHGVVLEQQPLTSLPGFASREQRSQPVAAGVKLLPELVRPLGLVYRSLSCPCFPLIWFWELGNSSFMLLWWIMASFFNHTVLLPSWKVRRNLTLWWLVPYQHKCQAYLQNMPHVDDVSIAKLCLSPSYPSCLTEG